MSVTKIFPDDQLRMLQWLYREGLESAKAEINMVAVPEMQALKPKVDSMIADVPVEFTMTQLRILAQAVDLGRDRGVALINSGRMDDQKFAIGRLIENIGSDKRAATEAEIREVVERAFDRLPRMNVGCVFDPIHLQAEVADQCGITEDEARDVIEEVAAKWRIPITSRPRQPANLP